MSDIFYQNTIRDEYEREHNELRLKDTDEILHIGCGMYPFSALVLSAKPHKRIVAIDSSDYATMRAAQVVEKKHLKDHVFIDKGEGSSYPLDSYSVIIISGCVDLTRNVLDHVISHAQPDTRIIIRELRPMSRYLKKYLENKTSIIFVRKYSTYSFPFYSILGWDSFILRKKK